MSLGAISLATVGLPALIVVASVAVTLGVYYLASGDWLWSRGEKSDARNWMPPR